MGATSAFHEGGDHVAYRTGDIAGRLAGQGRLDRYNREWQSAIGDEVRRNVAFAELVRGWNPDDWDAAFAAGDCMQDLGGYRWREALRTGLTGIKCVGAYKWFKRAYGDAAYVQIRENEYTV